MGVRLELYRIEPERLVSAIERVSVAAHLLGPPPPPMGQSRPSALVRWVRHPRAPKSWKVWRAAFSDRVFGAWQRVLSTETAGHVGLGKSWHDFALLSGAGAWAGETHRSAPSDAEPLALAAHGAHSLPSEVMRGMDFPVRFNTAEEVAGLSAALSGIDLKERIATFDVDTLPVHDRPSWIEPDGTASQDGMGHLLDSFERLRASYRRAAQEGESVICVLG